MRKSEMCKSEIRKPDTRKPEMCAHKIVALTSGKAAS